MNDIRKALTFRASSIGDSLMGKYLLENIHAAYPESRCSLLVAGKGAMVRDLLAAYPWIDVIEANSAHPQTILAAFRKLYPSDASVTQYSGRGAFATASKLFARVLTRSGRLVGFTDTWSFNGALYDHLLPFDSRRALRLHECDALAALGIPVSVPELTLVPRAGSDVLRTLGLSQGSYVVLNLFSGSTKRGISLVHQRAITRAVQETVGGEVKLVLTGGPSDEPLLRSIQEAVPEVLVAPGLAMQDLITLVAESRAVVSLDTGVGHIAAQTGVPLVVLRTCWGYNWWNKDQYPRENIRVLAHDELCEAGHLATEFPACLGAITPEEVARALTRTLIPGGSNLA